MPATHRRTRTRRHARRRRNAVCAVVVALGLGIIAAVIAWQGPAGKPSNRTDAAYCGLVACAALQPGVTATATPVTPAASTPVSGLPAGGGQGKSRTSPDPAASASSAAPVPEPTVAPPTTTTSPPGPSPTPSPAPPATTPPPAPSPTPASADVTVTYSTPRQWPGGFLGQLTIVNQGGPAVTGWQIAITLPGDQVQRVWGADWEPTGNGSVIMTPMPGDQVIEPGASLSVSFVVQGTTTELANCTFNGSPCS